MEAGLSILTGVASESSMWKLSRSGDDIGSLGGYSYCSLHFCRAGYGSLALRQVANRANLGWPGAQLADETDEIDEAREDRDAVSAIMDSGEDAEDVVDVAKDGRRQGK